MKEVNTDGIDSVNATEVSKAIRKLKREHDRTSKIINLMIILAVLMVGIFSVSVVSALSAQSKIADIQKNVDAIQLQLKNQAAEIEKQSSKQSKLNDAVYDMGLKVDSVQEQTVNRSMVSRNLPNVDTSAKTYMDYKCIGAGYQLDLQNGAWTDDQGFRRYGDDYMVALGSYYGIVGDRFQVTLAGGRVFTIIKGDSKSDADTDSLGMHRNGNVIEFIIDTGKISSKSRSMGDMSYSGFEGTITAIDEL